MEIDLIRRYIRDAHQAYQACMAGQRVSGSNSDLSALLRAARRGEIARRGEVLSPEGNGYEYHVHGSGYSFKERKTGKEIHFDLMPVDGVDHIRFSAWEVYKYGSSVGEAGSEETVATELRRLSAEEPFIVHVVDGACDYYYCSAREARAEQGRNSFTGPPPILCPRCTAVLQPWAEGMQQQVCPLCGEGVSR